MFRDLDRDYINIPEKKPAPEISHSIALVHKVIRRKAAKLVKCVSYWEKICLI